MNADLILASKGECESICKIDSKDSMLTSEPAKYVKNNTFAYYVLINTWLHLIRVCDRYVAGFVLTYLKRKGLIPFIRECDETALQLVKGEGVDMSKLSFRIYEAARNHPLNITVNMDDDFTIFREPLSTALQLLRYPKRFSPRNNDVIQSNSLREFLDVENRNKLTQRVERPVFLITLCKDIIADLLPWDHICDLVERRPKEDLVLPPGATFEGLRTIGEKVTFLASEHPELFVAPMGVPYVFPYLISEGIQWDVQQHLPRNVSEVRAVPKSYKAARIIAMEGLYRQTLAASVLEVMMPFLPPMINIRDQSRNQHLAQMGSEYDSVVTLDASHASDYITKSLWRELFPARFVSLVDPLLGNYTRVGDKVRLMQMCSTSGHELTFIIETIVYYAIAAAATYYNSLFTDGQWTPDNRDPRPGEELFREMWTTKVLNRDVPVVSVYGDDTIVCKAAAETAIEFFGMLGLKINRSKSFLDGAYRESCGEEYYGGVRTTSVYFPRFPLVGSFIKDSISLGVRLYKDAYRGKTDDSTTMLVDLQRRLFKVSIGASCFVEDIVRQVRPKMTSSPQGSLLPDMWSYTSYAPEVTPVGYTTEGKRVPLKPEVAQQCKTERHSYVSLRYKLDEMKLTEAQRRAFDNYKYQKFLLHGPTYSDPLLKLLGISDRPLSYKEAFGAGRLEWGSIVI